MDRAEEIRYCQLGQEYRLSANQALTYSRIKRITSLIFGGALFMGTYYFQSTAVTIGRGFLAIGCGCYGGNLLANWNNDDARVVFAEMRRLTIQNEKNNIDTLKAKIKKLDELLLNGPSSESFISSARRVREFFSHCLDFLESPLRDVTHLTQNNCNVVIGAIKVSCTAEEVNINRQNTLSEGNTSFWVDSGTTYKFSTPLET